MVDMPVLMLLLPLVPEENVTGGLQQTLQINSLLLLFYSLFGKDFASDTARDTLWDTARDTLPSEKKKFWAVWNRKYATQNAEACKKRQPHKKRIRKKPSNQVIKDPQQ